MYELKKKRAKRKAVKGKMVSAELYTRGRDPVSCRRRAAVVEETERCRGAMKMEGRSQRTRKTGERRFGCTHSEE